MKTLRLYQREPSIYTLGPGKRYCVWVQGCNRNCPGCMSVHSRDKKNGYSMSVSALAMEIKMAKPDGITISGGEPFLQAEALVELLHLLKTGMHCDLGVIVYTGYTIEELQQMPSAQLLLEQVDLLIDGPYMQTLDDGGSLRGSSNQRVIPLTERYNKQEILSLYGQKKREFQVVRHSYGISRIGVANENDKKYEVIDNEPHT